MLFNKRFSLKTVYYRSFFLLIVIPILLVSVVTLGIIRYMMEKSAIANIQNAQASIEAMGCIVLSDVSNSASSIGCNIIYNAADYFSLFVCYVTLRLSQP